MKGDTSVKRLSKRTNFKKGIKPSQRVSELIARYYLELRDKLCKGKRGNFLSMSYEDIFHNAVLSVMQDSKTEQLTTDSEILASIEHKYRITEMQIIRDSLQINNIPYADNQQTSQAE